MSDFPRTTIEDVSVSRMFIGINWFLGFSHTSRASDNLIKRLGTREAIADILEVFFRAGVDCVYGARPGSPQLLDAIRDAEDRTGRPCVRLGTPTLRTDETPDAQADNARTLDEYARIGCRICMPHQNTTDVLLDRSARDIRGMAGIAEMIRRRGMIPGISTHTPEAPVYADERGMDIQTYCQIYNAAGFLMQVEVDWVHRLIWERRKPVITIKPMAAGRVSPFVGLTFSFATIRPIDMVAVGCLTPFEAAEDIEISRAAIERRPPAIAGRNSPQKTAAMGATTAG